VVHPQAEHVHLALVDGSAQLDAGNYLDAELFARRHRLRDARDGVVVGDGDGGEARLFCEPDKLRRGVLAIGLIRMGMQVDGAWYQFGRPLRVRAVVVTVGVLYQRGSDGIAASGWRIGSTTVAFGYDGFGRRVEWQTGTGAATNYWYDQTGMSLETGGTNSTYLRDMMGGLLSRYPTSARLCRPGRLCQYKSDGRPPIVHTASPGPDGLCSAPKEIP